MFDKTARSTKRFLVSLLPNSLFYQYHHIKNHKKTCNFHKPVSFSEKIYHRMRYPLPIFSTLADKVLVRDHIRKTVGEQYLVPVFFSCKTVSATTFNELPNTFVMKANHSAGQVKIIIDKRNENIDNLVELANNWLSSDFSNVFREKHYRHIEPQIIFEHALLTNGNPPADYKFNVFNDSKASAPYIFIQYMQDRFGSITQNLFLEDWTPAPFTRAGQQQSSVPIEKPKALDEMLLVAKKLSQHFGYLRVDFYLHNDKVFIGELTITPAAGNYTFDPPEYNSLLGEKFSWPEH